MTNANTDPKEQKNAEELHLPLDFYLFLYTRIETVRKKLKLEKDEYPGFLFMDTDHVREFIIDCVLESTEENPKMVSLAKENIEIVNAAKGLLLKKSSIKKKHYDTLITVILKRMAKVDYANQVRVDFC